MTFPAFNENGDLPVDTYKATFAGVIEYFGKGSLQRRLVAQRLNKIYDLATGIGKLVRFVIYGSFVTSKENPNDVDVFFVMKSDFVKNDCSGDVKRIFEHLEAENKFKASIFWMLEMSAAVSEKIFIEG